MLTGIKELFERSDTSGSKSTILKPLTWLISILIGGFIFLINFKAPNWTIILFSIVICIILILFIFVYIFCLIKDRDALRSEKYSIQKMAIEKGIIGDNLSGIVPDSLISRLTNRDLSGRTEEES